MKTSRLIISTIIAAAMAGGPPAAELMHESDKEGHHEALPPGSHDHPIEDHDTSPVVFYISISANTTSPSASAVVKPFLR